VHHCTIQINHHPDATVFQFIILTFVYSSTCFGRFPAHHQELNDCSGSLWFYLHIVVTVMLCSWSGRPAGPTTEKLLLQVGDLFELNVKLRYQKVKETQGNIISDTACVVSALSCATGDAEASVIEHQTRWDFHYCIENIFIYCFSII
jgi:hypothetical protein